MMTPILRKISTPEAVVEHFREQFRSGALPPGSKLPSERELTASFGISRFSLREGLARLNALGLVRIVHGKGAFISEEVDDRSLADVLIPLQAGGGQKQTADYLEARVLLEGELSALAATRHTPEQIAALDANLTQAEAHLSNKEAFCLDDLRFHKLIAEMANNTFLLKMHAALWDYLYPDMLKKAGTRKVRVVTLDRHRAMHKAIQSGDAKRVRKLSATFLRSGQQAF